jgi:hypothetical protein
MFAISSDHFYDLTSRHLVEQNTKAIPDFPEGQFDLIRLCVLNITKLWWRRVFHTTKVFEVVHGATRRWICENKEETNMNR